MGVQVKALRFPIIVGMGLMIVSFQNCSQTSFGSGDEALNKSSMLVPVNDTSDPDVGTDVTGNDDIPNQEQPDHESAPPTDNEQPKHQCSKEYTKHNSGELVACILDGPGKSLKLGMISENLDGVTSVAQSVCISRKACLDLVPAVFKVKGVETRGYCDHNPNVLRLTDSEVKTLLGI